MLCSVVILSILNRFSWNGIRWKTWLNIALKMICVACNASGIYSHNKISHVQTDLHVMGNAAATDLSRWHDHKSHLALALRFDKLSCAFVRMSTWNKPPTWFALIWRGSSETHVAWARASTRWRSRRSGTKKWKRRGGGKEREGDLGQR